MLESCRAVRDSSEGAGGSLNSLNYALRDHPGSLNEAADRILFLGWVGQSATDKELSDIMRHEEVTMIQDDDHPVRLPSTLDHEKLAEAALGLLSLTLHEEGRVWKALDWDLMNLLYHKGWIGDPVSKAKSVVLTEESERLAGEFLQKHFGRSPDAGER